MSDTIHLRGIRASGKHGATSDERNKAQPFDIDLELTIDLQTASLSDNLDDTVDYSFVHKQIVDIVQAHSYRLLERLARAILDAIFADLRVAAAQITIAKPGLLNGATPAVTLSRRNPGL